jgi:hypothetical protein
MNYYGYENNFQNSGRIPIIPLPYEMKALAVENEFIYDNKTGSIYFAKKDGSLFDITSKLAELIQNANASNTEIEIEGIEGTIKLSRILQILWENKVTFTSKENVSAYIPVGKQFDFKSTELKNNFIQLYGFDQADEECIPVKINGRIYWRKATSASTELSPTQVDGNSLALTNGVYSIMGFNEAHTNQLPIKQDGIMKWVNINEDGSFGMTDEERALLTDAASKIETLSSQVNTMLSDVATFKSYSIQNSNNIDNLINDMGDIYEMLNDTSTNVDNINTYVESLQENDIINKVSNIDNRVKTNSNEIINIKNSISSINNNNASVEQNVLDLSNRLNDHVNDMTVHTSLHIIYPEETAPEEKISGHTYFVLNQQITNDVPDYYEVLLTNSRNVGALVQFKFEEPSNYDINDDISIKE